MNAVQKTYLCCFISLLIASTPVHALFTSDANPSPAFDVSFGTVSDPDALQPVCSPSTPPFLELRPASRALSCINVGAFTVYGLLEVHVELTVDNRSTSLAMFQHLVEPDAPETQLPFSFYVPEDLDHNETSEASLRLAWELTEPRNRTVIAEGTDTVPVLTDLADKTHVVYGITEPQTIVQAGQVPIHATLAAAEPLDHATGLSFRLLDASGGVLLEGFDVLPSLGPVHLDLVPRTHAMALGAQNLTLETRLNGTASDAVQRTQMPVVVMPPGSSFSAHRAAWNSTEVSRPLHPGASFRIDLNHSNLGSVDHDTVAEFACKGPSEVRLAAPFTARALSSQDTELMFSWPSIETYGQYGCTLSAGATIFGMTVREVRPWPVEVMSNVVAVNTSLPDEEGPTLTLDDETLRVNLSFFNAGRSAEPIDWSLVALSGMGDVSIELGKGIIVLDTEAQSSTQVVAVVPTCSTTSWDLILTTTDRYGTSEKQHIVNGFNTTRAAHDVSVRLNLPDSGRDVAAGTMIPLDVTIESFGEQGVCEQERRLDVRVASIEHAADVPEVRVFPVTVALRGGSTHVERVWVNTSGLDVAGAYIVDAQLTKGNSGQLLTQFDSATQSDSFNLMLSDKLLDQTCSTSSTVSTREVEVTCLLSNPSARSLAYRTHFSVDGSDALVQSGWIAPGEDIGLSQHLYLERWGSSQVDVDLQVLNMGAWTEQSAPFTQVVTATHPSDGAPVLRSWRLIPDIPQAGQPFTVLFDVYGTPQSKNASLNLTVGDLGGDGFDGMASLHLDELSLGETAQPSIKFASWPAGCMNHVVSVSLVDQNGIPLGQSVRKGLALQQTHTACPTVLPDYRVESAEVDQTGSVSINVSNQGKAAQHPSVMHLYLDGKMAASLEIPPLAEGETRTVNHAATTSFNHVEVHVDAEGDITERYEGASNFASFDRSHEVGTLTLLDLDGNGLLSNAEAALGGHVLDADGDGLLDADELEPRDITVISSLSQLQAMSDFFESMKKDGGAEEAPPTLTVYSVTSQSNSFDSDGDGLTDYGEFIEGTDPMRADTDGDGLSDLSELLDPEQDPLVVELDPAVVRAQMPNVIGDKWLTTTYELVFWVDEPNMAAVDVAIYNGDDAEPREVLMPERIDAPASLGLSEEEEARVSVFRVEYTLGDLRLWNDLRVVVNVTDAFGSSVNIDVANHSSLRTRVSNTLADYVMSADDFLGADGLLTAGLATVVGFIYGLFTVLKDFAELVVSVGRFIVTMLTEFASTISSILTAVYDFFDDFDKDDFVKATKEVLKSVVAMAMSLSPFNDNRSNGTFLALFLVTFIVGSSVLESYTGGAAMAGFRAAAGKIPGGVNQGFLGKFLDTLRSMKNKASDIVAKPVAFFAGMVGLAVSIPKKILLAPFEAFSDSMVRVVIHYSNIKTVITVFSKAPIWIGKKLDLNAAHRLERALVMVGSESYQAALKQFAESPKELKKYKDILTNTVQNRNLLTGMDNYAKLPNGRGVERQQAMMDRLAADVGNKMADKGLLRGQVLNEYRHVGVHERAGGGFYERALGGNPRGSSADMGDQFEYFYDVDGNIEQVNIIEMKTNAFPSTEYYDNNPVSNYVKSREKHSNKYGVSQTEAQYHQQKYSDVWGSDSSNPLQYDANGDLILDRAVNQNFDSFYRFHKKNGMSDAEIEDIYRHMEQNPPGHRYEQYNSDTSTGAHSTSSVDTSDAAAVRRELEKSDWFRKQSPEHQQAMIEEVRCCFSTNPKGGLNPATGGWDVAPVPDGSTDPVEDILIRAGLGPVSTASSTYSAAFDAWTVVPVSTSDEAGLNTSLLRNLSMLAVALAAMFGFVRWQGRRQGHA